MPQKRSVEPGDGGDPPIQYLISISAVFCLLAGFILGSSFGSHLLQDFIDGFYGYRWNYLERCIIDDGTFAGGYCRYIQSKQRFCSGLSFCSSKFRAPKKCTCGDVDKIDDVDFAEMTEELYNDRYAATNRPVIIRNISSEWAAMTTVDYDWLKEQYTASAEILDKDAHNCFFKCYKTDEFKTLRDVFLMSRDRFSGDVSHVAQVKIFLMKDNFS